MNRIVLCCLALALPVCATGQSIMEDTDTLEYRLPTEIVVTVPRMSAPLKEVPFSTSIVGEKTIRELPRSFAADEAMKLVPGVKVDNQANGSRVHMSIRGQGILTERGIRGIRIIYDGIPLNDPTGFAPDFFDVDFSAVDRIEVLRGAAASLYGASASGGIVNVLSRSSPATPLFGRAHATVGTNAYWKLFGEFGGNVEDVNYRVSMSRTMGDGYRVHTHFWGDNIYGKAVYTPTPDIVITPILGWTSVYHENPEGINLAQYNEDPKQANPDAVPFNEYLQTERMTGGVAGTLFFTPRHEVQFNAYAKRALFTEANNRTFNHRTIVTPGGSLQYTFHTGDPGADLRNAATVGTDLGWQTIDEHRVDNLRSVEGDTLRSKQRIEQRGIGAFLIDRISVGSRWDVTLSLRYDKIHNGLTDQLRVPYDASGSADFEKATGRIGATYTHAQELNLFANWGQGFLPPATEELAQNPDNFGGFNTHLTYATSNGFDLGVRGELRENLYYDLTGFYLATKNDFDRYRISDPQRNQETFYRNAGASKRFGVEFFTRYAPLPPLEVRVAYTYSHFVYDIDSALRVVMDDPTNVKYIQDGNYLPNSPAHQLAIDVSWRALPDLVVGLSAETLSKTYIDGANIEAEAASGYTLIGARVMYRWTAGALSGELSLQGRNLAGTKYVAFTEPDPGGNSYQPGAGREFFAGVKIDL